MSYGSPASTYGAAPQYGAAGLPAQGGGGGVPPGSVRLDEPAPGNVIFRYTRAGIVSRGSRTYVTQEICNVLEGRLERLFESSTAMLVVDSHFVMQLTTAESTPVVKRLLPLVDIEAINVDITSSKIHFKVKPQAKIRDWLFFLQNRGSHSKFGEVLTTIDKLRMLCMAEPRSLQPWGTINPAQVQTQKRPGSIEPKQLILAYKNGSLKMPLRKHRPGSIYPPITQEQQQLQPQEHFPPPPVRQAEASPPPTNPQVDHIFRKLDGKVRQYIIRLDHPDQSSEYVYSARLPHEGIRILEIVPNSPLHKAGAPCGHLTSIEGRPISTETDVMQELHRLRSEGQTEYVIEMIADPEIAPLPPYRPPVPVDNFETDSQQSGPLCPDDPPLLKAPPSPQAPLPPYRPPVPVDDADNFETESQQDTEEYLAEKLHDVATMRRKGAIPEGEYQEIRGKIIRLLNKDGKSIPDESSFAPLPVPVDNFETDSEQSGPLWLDEPPLYTHSRLQQKCYFVGEIVPLDPSLNPKSTLTVIATTEMIMQTKGPDADITELVYLTDIDSIRMNADSVVHIRLNRQGRLHNCDWLFSLEGRSREKTCAMLTAVDRLWMLCMHAQCSLQPWGPFIPEDVQRERPAGYMNPRERMQRIAQYMAGGYKGRIHEPGLIYPPPPPVPPPLPPQAASPDDESINPHAQPASSQAATPDHPSAAADNTFLVY